MEPGRSRHQQRSRDAREQSSDAHHRSVESNVDCIHNLWGHFVFVVVAGFCRAADHVCCVVADDAPPERYSAHDDDDDDNPLTGPLDESTGMREQRDPAQFKPFVAPGEVLIVVVVRHGCFCFCLFRW